MSSKYFHRLRQLGTTLLAGQDPPKKAPITTIKPHVLLGCVEWITGTFQYRPGILRNYRINGYLIKNLPVFIRVGPMRRIFASYKAAMTAKHQQHMGRDLFFIVLKALTEPSSANAGLSYYYVNHIDLVAELREMMKSVSDRMPQPIDEALGAAIDNLDKRLTFATDYLKYSFQHDLALSTQDGWLCATLAVGGDCNHNHTLDSQSKLSLVLSIRPVISDVATALRNIPEGLTVVTAEEIDSIDRIALLTEKEFHHYAKHLVRDWWQSKHIKDTRLSLGPT
ncbi:MAG: hypothetical protein VXY99_10140, partial [Pseudomonadota bacterium]|nr:hypothetical protein [Pseudomonadota bacterium]